VVVTLPASAPGALPSGGLHAASVNTIAAAIVDRQDRLSMWLLIVEALAALVLLVLIVWWTMFSGRSRGERRSRDDD